MEIKQTKISRNVHKKKSKINKKNPRTDLKFAWEMVIYL